MNLFWYILGLINGRKQGGGIVDIVLDEAKNYVFTDANNDGNIVITEANNG